MPKTITPALSHEETMELFHQDGILEIITGAVLLNFGFDILNYFNSTTGNPSATSLFTYIPIILLSSMKKQVTISRLGLAPFGGDDRKVRKWNLGIAAGLVVMLLVLSSTVLVDLLHLRETIALPAGFNIGSLLAGVILSLACLAAAYFIPLKRFYTYAAVALAAGVIAFVARLSPAIPVFFCAIVLLAPGIRMMVRFSRANPLPEVNKPASKK